MTRPAGDPADTDPLGREYADGEHPGDQSGDKATGPAGSAPGGPSWLGEPWPERPGRRRGPWPLLIGLVLLGLLLWGLVRCGVAAHPPGAAAPPAPGIAGNPTVHPARPTPVGTLTTSGGTSVFPLAGSAGPNGELTSIAGEEVTGSLLQVLSALSGGGFWAGNTNTERIWVELAPASPEPPAAVRPGDLVDLTGRIVAHGPDFAARHGVDATAGADQLTRQAAHVEARADRVRPVGTP